MITRYSGSKNLSSAVKFGQQVYVSGIVSGNKGDVVEQTADCLAQLDALLTETGGSRARLLMVNIWLADVNDFAAMNEVWLSWIPADALPARATVQSGLAGPEYRVEIAAIAAIA